MMIIASHFYIECQFEQKFLPKLLIFIMLRQDFRKAAALSKVSTIQSSAQLPVISVSPPETVSSIDSKQSQVLNVSSSSSLRKVGPLHVIFSNSFLTIMNYMLIAVSANSWYME